MFEKAKEYIEKTYNRVTIKPEKVSVKVKGYKIVIKKK